MGQLLDPILIVALALNFVALGVSRIRGVINAVAVQGSVLGICLLCVTGALPGLLGVPASLATVWPGFLLLTTRKKAITQVLGYLLLENGIFLFALLLLEAMPFLVEVGVLLDLFTGVFVMGIIIFHINREFSSISTEHLSELKE